MVSSAKHIVALLRPHQYVKNLFVLMPLFFVGRVGDVDLLARALLSFVAFCCVASSVYVLNDVLDVEADRKHPRKRHRPLPSGAISVRIAASVGVVCAAAGLGLALLVSPSVLGVLAGYAALNVAYCVHLKHVAILDVVVIGIGFVLRLFVGSVATSVPLSMWIVVMTFLLALFLGLAKRRDDLLLLAQTGKSMRRSIDGYNLQFVDAAMAIMASVVIVAYLLYTTTHEVVDRLGSEHLYLTSLFVIVGILRYLQIAFVEEQSGSPTRVVLRDRTVQGAVVLWLLAFAWILY